MACEFGCGKQTLWETKALGSVTLVTFYEDKDWQLNNIKVSVLFHRNNTYCLCLMVCFAYWSRSVLV